MKKIILLLMLAVILSYGKINSIADIRQEYKNINSIEKMLTVKKREISDISAEGAEAIYYYDKGSLKIVKLTVYGETFKSFEEYYFNNGKLFFLYSKDYRYNAPMYATEYFDPKKTKIITGRFYFIDNKMVKWLDSKHKDVAPNSSRFKNKEKEIIDFVNKNLIDEIIILDKDNEGYEKIIAQKIKNGKIVWSKTVAEANPGAINILEPIQFFSNKVIAGHTTIGGTGESKYWIKAISKSGLIVWQKEYETFPNYRVFKLFADGDKVVLIAIQNKNENDYLWAVVLNRYGKELKQKFLIPYQDSQKVKVKIFKDKILINGVVVYI